MRGEKAGDVAVHRIPCAPQAGGARVPMTRSQAAPHGPVFPSDHPVRPIPRGAVRVPAAAVGVRLLLLPAERLLRAAAGARGDGGVQRCAGGLPARHDRVLRRARPGAEGFHPAGAVHLHLHHHAAVAAGLRLAGQPVSASRVPAGGLRLLHRHAAAVLRAVRQRDAGTRDGLLPVDRGVQPVRGRGVLELHGGCLQQCRSAQVLRLHRRGRHGRRDPRPRPHPHLRRAHRHRQLDAGVGRFPAGARGMRAAPAPVGGGARAGTQGDQRRDADGGRSAGRTEADRPGAAAALAGVAGGDGRGRGHAAVQRTGRDRAGSSTPTRPPVPPTTPASTWR